MFWSQSDISRWGCVPDRPHPPAVKPRTSQTHGQMCNSTLSSLKHGTYNTLMTGPWSYAYRVEYITFACNTLILHMVSVSCYWKLVVRPREQPGWRRLSPAHNLCESNPLGTGFTLDASNAASLCEGPDTLATRGPSPGWRQENPSLGATSKFWRRRPKIGASQLTLRQLNTATQRVAHPVWNKGKTAGNRSPFIYISVLGLFTER